MATITTVPVLRETPDDLVLVLCDTTPKADVDVAPVPEQFEPEEAHAEANADADADTEENNDVLAEMLENRLEGRCQDFLSGVYAKIFFGTVFSFKYAAELLASRQKF